MERAAFAVYNERIASRNWPPSIVDIAAANLATQMKEVIALPGHSSKRGWAFSPHSLETPPRNCVHVWRLHLNEISGVGSETNLLSSDELARSERFHFEKDRIRFTRCRSELRRLLANYLLIPAVDLQFEYSATGKPRLNASQNPKALQFNVSHSGDIALIAIGGGPRLGVDIERMRESVDHGALVQRFFSLRERAGWQALPLHLHLPGFYACWTRKESFLKATGDGLSFPLADFSVSVRPDCKPEIEEIKEDLTIAKRWSLADLEVADGYRAALALEHPDGRLEAYSLS